MQFAINMQRVGNRKKKIRISKEPRAENLQKASSYFKDKVYTPIVDLDSSPKMFTANLYCNKKCYANYIGKWNRATSTLHKSARAASKTKREIFKNYFLFIISAIDERMVFCLSDISDMIN